MLIGIASWSRASTTSPAWANLVTLETISRSSCIFLPFAIIVLFQHEIRRGLANFGRGPFFGAAPAPEAAGRLQRRRARGVALAARKIGALIVFERQEGLRNYVENGIAPRRAGSPSTCCSTSSPRTRRCTTARSIVQGERIAPRRPASCR